MEKAQTRSKWLPLAIAAAVAITNPFMLVAVGSSLGLLFLCCDRRPLPRRISGVALAPLLALASWYYPIFTLFAATAAFCGVWSLRANLFSSVTSSALLGCIIAAAFSVLVIWRSAPDDWRQIEKGAVAMQERWQKATSGGKEAEPLDRKNWETLNRMTVRILPGQYILMMLASFFLTVILYRRYGESRLPISMLSSRFQQYRFEDDWIWLVIVGLVVALFFSKQEVLLRVALNILFVMGVLYVIRGLAVIFYFIIERNGGVILRVIVVALCLTPLIMFHLFLGLLDTWMDFRHTVPATK